MTDNQQTEIHVSVALRVADWRLMRIDEVWYFVCETCGHSVRRWPGDDAPKTCERCATLIEEVENGNTTL